MYRTFLHDPKFFRFLAACDEELAEEARRAGCPHCGGRLHRADYPRKPRGVPEQVEAGTVLRRSWCCEREGCRRRTTPASLRFLGRRVYSSVAVIVVGAMDRTRGAAWRALIELLGVSERTLRRWRRWWQTTFAASGFWRGIRGLLREAVAAADLPLALMESFEGSARSRLLALLRLLVPITGGSPDPVLAP